MSKIKIIFAGGAGTATGSNFLLEAGKVKILVDCGLYQGEKLAEEENRGNFPFDPKSIDFLFITHAHLDHVGRIPKLTKEGFSGTIYSTPATKDLAELVLEDSVGLLAKEATRAGLVPIYEKSDIEKALVLWKTKKYHEELLIDSGDKDIGNIKITLFDSGHILGSCMVVFDIKGKRFMFTGDLGNSPSPLLKDTEKVEGVNYLIMESVYGDRNHNHRDDRVDFLKNTIKKLIQKKGTLMIPAFSIERTQELIFVFNEMVENKEIPLIPVFLDSPLGINVTKVYQKYEKDFNENIENLVKKGEDIFSFAGLNISKTSEDSKAIALSPSPKIIIAGSGMSNGGRIVYHEARYLPDPKNTLLLVGYQAAGTMGRKLQNGMKKIRIHGEDVDVRAEVIEISGFSAHKDSNHLQEFAAEMKDSLEKVFVVLGEPKSQSFLAQRLIDIYHLPVTVPQLNDIIEIDI
ncbi:MAG: MBL fold metallo-hydrolase [Candidatus Pacebacteria bacterium]|nr:MBL fold metallo-hydrolase [Candidatus Paceibacterota bacterium]